MADSSVGGGSAVASIGDEGGSTNSDARPKPTSLAETAKSWSKRLIGKDDIDDSKTDDPVVVPTGDGGDVTTASDHRSEAMSLAASAKSLADVEQSAVRIQGTILPKTMKVLPWRTFFLLSVAIACSASFYIVVFTKMGYGMVTFYYLSNHIEEYAYALGLGLVGLTFLLYISDCYYWDSPCGIAARRIFVVSILAGLALLLLTLSGRHPYGPISLYVVLTPLWMFMIKLIFYKKVRTKNFICWLSGPFLFISTVVFIAWAVWAGTSNENEWNSVNRLFDAMESGCKPDFEDRGYCRLEQNNEEDPCFTVNSTEASLHFPDGCQQSCTDVYDECLNTFILWVGPFLVSLGLCFLSFFSTFLRGSGSVEAEALNFAKIWLFLLFAMWVSASLAGAGAGVSTTLAALTLSSFVGSALFLASSFSRIEHEARLEQLWHNLIEKYGHYMDMARGLLVATCTPIFAIYIFASFLNQQLRNISTYCSLKYGKPDDDSTSLRNIGGRGWVTIEARRAIREINSWDKIAVYTYATYWGIGFMSLVVFANKFTTLFLSWLIEETQTMAIGSVTGILIGVGTIMFLLPPVPGAPIYLTMGIVIIPVGRQDFGLVWANVYAVAVSLGLKLLATVLQQKMIGELLRGSVGVRKLVGINSTLIRAMKLVLQNPGISFAKVSILCGGPDWPTSVLCGIMGLDLLPVLIGTLPIIALVLPTVLTGSFTYMGSLKDADQKLLYPWAETAKAICAAMAALVLFANMFFAAIHVEDTIRTRKEELDAIPIDTEVLEAEEKAEKIAEAYKKVTEWKFVPWCAKAILILSMISVIASCWMVQMFQDHCFEDYDLTYSISTHLDGDWKNFIKPAGSLAIMLFIFSIFLLQIFTSWATQRAKEKLADAVDEVNNEPEPETRQDPIITTSQSEGGVEISSSLVTFSEDVTQIITVQQDSVEK